MNKQPTEILLLFTDYLDNRDSISFLRLSSSFWSSHRSPAGRYRLKTISTWNFKRPSLLSSSSLQPLRSSPFNGHYLLSFLFLENFDDFPLVFPSDEKEISPIFQKVHKINIGKEILLNLTETSGSIAKNRRKSDSPRPTYLELMDFSRFQHLEELQMGKSSIFSLRPGIFPFSLRKLSFTDSFHGRLEEGILPDSLEELSFSQYNRPLPNRLPSGLKVLKLISGFNEPIGRGQLPRGLKILRLSESFDHPIELDSLPTGLEELYFTSYGYSHSFSPGVFPKSLKVLIFHHFLCYSHRILPGVLPESLESLDLSMASNYSHPCPPLPVGLKSLNIDCRLPLFPIFFPLELRSLTWKFYSAPPLTVGIFPSSLEEIEFCGNLFEPLPMGIFPDGLRKITFHQSIDHPLLPGIFPSSVEEIDFWYSKFNCSLSIGVLPIGLKKILFNSCYNQKLPVGIFPPGIHTIELGYCFSQPLEAGLFPSSVRKLKISTAHPLPLGLFPEGIEEIEFDKFNQTLLPGLFPSTLRRLKFQEHLYQDILPGVLPEGLCELSLGYDFLGYFPLSALPPYFHPDPSLDRQSTSEPLYLPDLEDFSGEIQRLQIQALIARIGADRELLRRPCRVPLSNCYMNDHFDLAEPLDGSEAFIVLGNLLRPHKNKRKNPSMEKQM